MPAILGSTTIGAAAANQVSSVLDFRANGTKMPLNLIVQFSFAYGGGGTSIAAYLQTSFDGGISWQDVASFSATTAAKRTVLSMARQTSVLVPITNTDGALAADTAISGVFGPIFRVKYTSVGTYTGATSLRVDVHGDD